MGHKNCEVCGKRVEAGTRRRKFEEAAGGLMACKECCFFRDNMGAGGFIRHARKIRRWREDGHAKSRTGCKVEDADRQPLSKRRFQMKKRDERRGCDPNDTVTFWQMLEVIESQKCWFCGACASGVDRKNVSDCYKASQGGMVASCAKCNRMCRDKGRNNFVRHMTRVAERWRNKPLPKPTTRGPT